MAKLREVFQKCFIKKFLQNKESIFRCEKIDIEKGIKYLQENFIKKPFAGNAPFEDKLKVQLDLVQVKNGKLEDIDKTQSSDDLKNAVEVLAHLLWLWRMVPSNANKKATEEYIKNILGWVGIELKNCCEDLFTADGIAQVGTYYYTNKPMEINFLIRFLEKVVNPQSDNNNNDENCNEHHQRSNSDNNEDCCKAYIEKILEVTNDGKIAFCDNCEEEYKFDFVDGEYTYIKVQNSKSASSQREVAMFNVLLHLFCPDRYEPIISRAHKEKIAELCKKFENLTCDCDENFRPEIDCKIQKIKQKIKEYLKEELNKEDIDFYDPTIKELWDETILPGRNIIYYGSPGTGKTYAVLELIKNKNIPAECWEFVQFHSGFTYEDFIDGIKPVGVDKSGSVQLKLVDGVFKKFCRRAFQELYNAKKEKREAKSFYFVVDEINRADLSAVFGEVLACLEEDKRLRFDENGNLQGLKIKTANASLWKNSDAVVVENGKKYFGIPENIYFIGTMNDVDRSIDSFDLALRRRFLWIRKDCDYDVIFNALLQQGVQDKEIEKYIKSCQNLNKYISNDLDMGKTYELGHAYFMKIDVRGGKISDAAKRRLFEQSLSPLIREYLRSMFDEIELDNHLKKLREIFLK